MDVQSARLGGAKATTSCVWFGGTKYEICNIQKTLLEKEKLVLSCSLYMTHNIGL